MNTEPTTNGPSLSAAARELADRTGASLADSQAAVFAAARDAAKKKPVEASNAAVLGDDDATISASVVEMAKAIANANCIPYEEGLALAKKIAATCGRTRPDERQRDGAPRVGRRSGAAPRPTRRHLRG
jgi:hypothetical protein